MTNLPWLAYTGVVYFAAIIGIVLLVSMALAIFRIRPNTTSVITCVSLVLAVLFFDEIYINARFAEFCDQSTGIQISEDVEIKNLEIRGSVKLPVEGWIRKVDFVDFEPKKIELPQSQRAILNEPAYRISSFSQPGKECEFYLRVFNLDANAYDDAFVDYMNRSFDRECTGLFSIAEPGAQFVASSQSQALEGNILYRELRSNGIVIKSVATGKSLRRWQDFEIKRGYFLSSWPIFAPAPISGHLKCGGREYKSGSLALSKLINQ